MRMHFTSNPTGDPPVDGYSLLHARLTVECRVAFAAHVNLLLIGPRPLTQSVVNELWRPDPAYVWSPGQPLTLPVGGGRVFLHDVGHLTRDDQQQLRQWLESELQRAQVVSTSPSPLMLRVAARAFDEALYYRLNTICVNAEEFAEEL